MFGEPCAPGAHEGHGLHALAGRKTRKGRGGERSLQRDQRRLVERREARALGQTLANEGEIDGLARRVDDEPQDAVSAGGARHHQVVDDAARLVQKLGIALTAGREIDDVGGNERLEESGEARVTGALDQRLAHMRHVEQPRRLAGMEMLRHHPGRKLDRHLVAGESGHAGAELDVQSVKGRLANRVVAHGPPVANRRGTERAAAVRPTIREAPPLSHDLRDFPPVQRLPPSVGARLLKRTPLSRASSLARS